MTVCTAAKPNRPFCEEDSLMTGVPPPPPPPPHIHTHTHPFPIPKHTQTRTEMRKPFHIMAPSGLLHWQQCSLKLTCYLHSNRDEHKVWSPPPPPPPPPPLKKTKKTVHTSPRFPRNYSKHSYFVGSIAWFVHVFIDFRWHLGFCSLKCTPLQRGYDSFMGFFNAMGDHYVHTSFGKNAWACCIFHYVS